MIGLGTLLNSAGILVGGLAGQLVSKRFRPEQQEALNKACGVSVLFIAIAGAMEGMLTVEQTQLHNGRSMLLVLCLAVGTVIGELLGIERGFERFGKWLKRKTGSSGDAGFVDAFVTASLTVSVGAMAIVGAIQDGLTGGILHSGGQVGSGLYPCSGDDCLDGARVPVFRYSCVCFRRRDHAAGTAGLADHDADGRLLFVSHRLGLDLLYRDKPCVGQKGAGGQYAAGGIAGGLGGIPPWSFT